MKDTLYIGTFLAVVVGFWMYLQKTDFGGLPSGQSTPVAMNSPSLPSKNTGKPVTNAGKFSSKEQT